MEDQEKARGTRIIWICLICYKGAPVMTAQNSTNLLAKSGGPNKISGREGNNTIGEMLE